MDVFEITKPHIYALFRTSIILKKHVFLKKVGHKVCHKNMHESSHACIKAQKKGCPPLGRHPQLKIELDSLNRRFAGFYLIAPVIDRYERMACALRVRPRGGVPVFLRFGGMMMLNGASNSTID